MEVLSRCMQTLTGEQYIQPHQAQILPKNDKEDLFFKFIQKNFFLIHKEKIFEIAINTYRCSNC